MANDVDVALSVDALSPHLTGIGRYCLELARGLPGATGVGNVSYFRGPHWLEDPESLLAEGWQPAREGKLRRQFGNWRRHRRLRGAIIHGPNYFLPDWAEIGVITVHDLSVLLYPDTHPVERIQDFERRFQQSLHRSAAVLTDSEAVRCELIEMLGVCPDRVHAVHLGVGLPVDTIDGNDAALAQFGLVPGRYSLCISTFEPRKRIDRLVEAYSRIDPVLRRHVPLVLAGASGWRNEALNERLARAQAEGWLKRLDFVPDAARDHLFHGARLFIYPSRYEGFGLPPIEAMQHGIPTIVGDAATLIEVTKGAARIVDPDDTPAFALALAEALEDEAWRSSAKEQGRIVADSYRWSDCVAKTVSVYNSVIRG